MITFLIVQVISKCDLHKTQNRDTSVNVASFTEILNLSSVCTSEKQLVFDFILFFQSTMLVIQRDKHLTGRLFSM